jgi:hypothetical protein
MKSFSLILEHKLQCACIENIDNFFFFGYFITSRNLWNQNQFEKEQNSKKDEPFIQCEEVTIDILFFFTFIFFDVVSLVSIPRTNLALSEWW